MTNILMKHDYAAHLKLRVERMLKEAGVSSLSSANGRSTTAQRDFKQMCVTYLSNQCTDNEVMTALSIGSKSVLRSIKEAHADLMRFNQEYRSKFYGFKHMEVIFTPSVRLQVGHVIACDAKKTPITSDEYEDAQMFLWGVITDIYELSANQLGLSIRISQKDNKGNWIPETIS